MAARLIERYFDELYLSSEAATASRWIAALPPDLVASRPRLNLVQAALNLIGGRLDVVGEFLDVAERAEGEAAQEPFEPSVGRAASRFVNIPAAIAVGRSYIAHLHGEGEAAVVYASEALAALDDTDQMLEGLAHTSRAMGVWVRGWVAEAQHGMEFCVGLWRSAGHDDLAMVASSGLGRIHRARGRLDAALETCRTARQSMTSPGRPLAPAAGIVQVEMAEVAYERDELELAAELVNEGLSLCRELSFAEFMSRGLALLARIRHAQGDPAGARRAMEMAENHSDPVIADLLNPVPAQRARLLLMQGETAAAAEWLASRGVGADDEPTYAAEPAYLVLVRLLLVQERAPEALRLLDRLRTLASAQRRDGSLIEIEALRALGWAAVGDTEVALSVLGASLSLAVPQGHVRVFVDEGDAMHKLIGRFIANEHPGQPSVPVKYLGTLTRAFSRSSGDAAPGAAASSTAGIVTGLSERELEVLVLLAAGKQNQEIAKELFVALSTVKKHVTHILSKLGAANRTEATVRARALGLLS
nr:LuxR C-terminal-related transcriptional regulator [Phytoactinopolyspora mesophila]